jgi:hypothetical protein
VAACLFQADFERLGIRGNVRAFYMTGEPEGIGKLHDPCGVRAAFTSQPVVEMKQSEGRKARLQEPERERNGVAAPGETEQKRVSGLYAAIFQRSRDALQG